MGLEKNQSDITPALARNEPQNVENCEVIEKHEDEFIEIHADDTDEKLRVATEQARRGEQLDPELRRKLVETYGRRAETNNVAPATDITLILDRALEMTEEQALEICMRTMESHCDDPNFPSWTMDKMRMLSQGYKVADMESSDWSFELRSLAAMIYNHSPYPEVRAVTEPFDDPTLPVETLRAYVLGLGLMAGSTVINTFFAPRQPAISLSGLVLQCILAPLGTLFGRYLPDWGFKIMGKRFSINPGPWTFKEQIFATIMIGVGNGAGGTYFTYLTQVCRSFMLSNETRADCCGNLSDAATVFGADMGVVRVRNPSYDLRPSRWSWTCWHTPPILNLPSGSHLALGTSHHGSESHTYRTRTKGPSHQWLANISLPLLHDCLLAHVHVVLDSQQFLLGKSSTHNHL